MKDRQSNPPLQIFELEISLVGIKPRIWRRFAIPDNRSLKILHDTIQTVMGWYDCHLHDFYIADDIYTARDPELDDLDDRKRKDERRAYLRDVLGGPGFTFRYLYDLGDDWEHVLRVIQVGPPEENCKYPVCRAGARACPPEDVGGAWGYQEMLAALANPRHEEHDSYVEWTSGRFEPEAFDMKRVNTLLSDIR